MPGGPLRVALTGGIATGKSTCLRVFRELGVPTMDADTLARAAVEPGRAGLAAVVARFGPGVLEPDGRLDRAALARVVFADAAARRDLEAIIHPFVFAAVGRWFAELGQARDGDATQAATGTVAVADVPLLYEAGAEGDFDRVVVAACAPGQQLARLMARDGLSAEDARLRVAAQAPLDDKRRRADYVIDTSGSEAETRAGAISVLEKLRAEAPGSSGSASG